MSIKDHVVSVEVTGKRAHSSTGYIFNSICNTKTFVLTSKHSICIYRNGCELLTKSDSCRKCSSFQYNEDRIQIKNYENNCSYSLIGVYYSNRTDTSLVHVSLVDETPPLKQSIKNLNNYVVFSNFGKNRHILSDKDMPSDGKVNFAVSHNADNLDKNAVFKKVSGGLIFKYENENYYAEAVLTEDANVNDIGAELLDDELVKELNRLTGVKLFDQCVFHKEEKSIDISGAVDYENLSTDDIRDLEQKIKDVSPNISDYRIRNYCRQLTSGLSELSLYPDQVIRSLKYRVWEVCHEELINFVEGAKEGTKLTYSEIEDLLQKYTISAHKRIEDRSKDYSYSITNQDTLRKVILDLINDCFLSFDEQGIL